MPDAAPTTTTTAPVDPQTADRLAQAELRSVLAAAQEWYAGSGTFDDGLPSVGGLAGSIEVVPLEVAAARDAVAYDAHDQRLTLHRQSTSGAWFCIDVQTDTIDHGYGNSFQESLTTCTDGVTVGGWGDSFSPTGPDEAAINGVDSGLLRRTRNRIRRNRPRPVPHRAGMPIDRVGRPLARRSGAHRLDRLRARTHHRGRRHGICVLLLAAAARLCLAV